jgi:hypothetical protein
MNCNHDAPTILNASLRMRLGTIGLVIFLALLTTSSAFAAITWDSQELTMESNPAGSGTQWWFDPFNWSHQDPADDPPYYLPPFTADGSGSTDTQINTGTTTLPGGEGVVYDPTNDPNFNNGPQTITDLYLSRQTTAAENLLTIKGDLTMQSNVQLGRSSNTVGLVATGRIVQESGTVIMNTLDVAATDTSGNVTGENYGNGVHDYRGGRLEVSLTSGSGIRLAPSSSTVGASGIGRFVMHNPSTPGYVRAFDYVTAAGAGIFLRLADGETTGVGISEFHFENGGTRPIQVARNLVINNGEVESGGGEGAFRSARLDLVLNDAPSVNGSGVPQDLGLFDVAFSNAAGNNTSGSGTLGDFFSSADGDTLYTQGATVSANYLGSTYNWTISYTGNITWADANLGTIGSISDIGGVDVVLKGLSSVVVPPPGIAGDYNDNGVVDAADYVVWRKNQGTSTDLPNDPNAVPIDTDQYNTWRANFGLMASGAGGGNATAAPEPASATLVLLALVGIGVIRRRP